jgi:hypothetical protein
MISRFRTKTEQKEILANLASGQLDIIVGTHRLLSRMCPRDLGLLVVDEEQRFGVTHKRTHQADAQESRHAHDDSDADSADAEYVLAGIRAYVRHRNAAARPPVDSDHVVKFDSDVVGRAIPDRARARWPGLL